MIARVKHMSHAALTAAWLIVLLFISGCHRSAVSPITAMPGQRTSHPSGLERSLSAPLGAEELWVIARPPEPAPPPSEDTPGSGALMTDRKSVV